MRELRGSRPFFNILQTHRILKLGGPWEIIFTPNLVLHMKELRSRKLGDLPLRSKLSFRTQAFNLLAVPLQQQFSVSPGDPQTLWGDCVVKIIFIIRHYLCLFQFHSLMSVQWSFPEPACHVMLQKQIWNSSGFLFLDI